MISLSRDSVLRRTCRTLRSFVTASSLNSSSRLAYAEASAASDPGKDWNACEDFFSFTRGRFVLDEADQITRHHTRFNMNELARIAADSVRAKGCVAVEKCPDGMYNKSFVLTMDDGQEVIAKVPNPNAGLRYLTTASEVATMDFLDAQKFDKLILKVEDKL